VAEVRLESVTKRFGATTAVDRLSLTVRDGEFVVLLGPTGAGKTTTLRLIAGLENADEGRILIGGCDATRASPAERDVAFVFQQYSLYPHLSVYDNLAFPLRSPSRRLAEDKVRARVNEIARLLHIENKLDNRATALSGGEMQRVAIGRALVRKPAIYLMDEPLSSLDAKLRAELRLELKRIHAELGATLLYVTHDQIEAMTMADRIGILREGRLVQIGPPREVYEQPNSIYVASRLGTPRINLLPADAVTLADAPPATATIGARTEHLRIASAQDDAQGAMAEATARVARVEHFGDQSHLHLMIGEHRLVTLVSPDSPFAPGDEVVVAFLAPLFFDSEGNRIGDNRRRIDDTLNGEAEWSVPLKA